MNKTAMAVVAAAALSLLCAPLPAQMDNLTNLSVEWMRMPARNAATDSSDIVVYNPAALVRLGEGFHLNIGNQSLLRKPSHTYDLGLGAGERSFGQDGPDPFLPNVYAAYNKGKWALYGGVYVSGGGAVANYPQGSLFTDILSTWMISGYHYDYFYTQVEDQFIKASSYYLTGLIGGAFAFSEAFSASLGMRTISAVNTMKMGFTLTDPLHYLPDRPLALDAKDKASGLGWILGAHFAATPKLDLSAHYESQVKLDFETTVNQDDFGMGFATPGAKSRRDLPAALYLGAGYRWTPRLQMLVDFNYWFQTAANWDTTTIDEAGTNWADLAGDCYAAGIGVAYELNDRLKLSAGAVFTNFLFKDRDEYFSRVGEVEAPKGDNWNCGIGLAYKALDKLTLNLALGGTFWKTQTIARQFVFPYTVEVKASAYSVSIGANIDL